VVVTYKRHISLPYIFLIGIVISGRDWENINRGRGYYIILPLDSMILDLPKHSASKSDALCKEIYEDIMTNNLSTNLILTCQKYATISPKDNKISLKRSIS